MYQRIVVPLDGSEVATVALPHARDAAKTHDAPILVVRVVDPPFVNSVRILKAGTQTLMADPADVYQDEVDRAHEYIDRQVQRLERDGFEASGLVMVGHAATAIAEAINETDLVVMSSHGRSGVRRWFLGSVAEDILKRTSVPVLIVRQPASSS